MAKLGDQIQQADWKAEKHAPVIECSDTVKGGESFEVKVSVGKEIAHPNTTEHHIRWIHLFFKPDGDKFAYQLGAFDFSAHGEAAAGPNEGPAYAEPFAVGRFKIGKSGTIYATSLCNIHGLWESSKQVKLA